MTVAELMEKLQGQDPETNIGVEVDGIEYAVDSVWTSPADETGDIIIIVKQGDRS